MDPEIPPPSADDVDIDLLEYLQTLTPLERLELNNGRVSSSKRCATQAESSTATDSLTRFDAR